MPSLWRLIVYSTLFAVCFYGAYALSRQDRAEGSTVTQPQARNPFNVFWESEGTGGRWKLAITPDRFESFLLLKSVEPRLEGLTAPQILSSKVPRTFTSQAFAEVQGIRISTASSHARLPDDFEMDAGKRLVALFPLAGCGRITQADGNVPRGATRTHGEDSGTRHAIDIEAPMGSVVQAALSGLVVFVEDRFPDTGSSDRTEEQLNNRIVVRHEDGTEGVYAHLMQGSAIVSEGDSVAAGRKLARLGNSGFSSGPHLHFHVGGLNARGYHTLPLDFIARGGESAPIAGETYCGSRLQQRRTP